METADAEISMEIGVLMFSMEFHGKCPNPPCKYFPWKSMEKFPWNSMEIDVLILHGIPWRIFHGHPWNSMVFHTGLFTNRDSVTFYSLWDTESKLAISQPHTNYLKNSIGYKDVVVWNTFPIRQLHDNIILLQLPKSFRVLISYANQGYCFLTIRGIAN